MHLLSMVALLERGSKLQKMLVLILACQFTMVVLCVWLIPFTIFALPILIEKFANLVEKFDKELKIKIVNVAFVRRCLTLDAVSKAILIATNYNYFQRQTLLDFFLRYSSFFMGTTLEVSFSVICYELVSRLNYTTTKLKELRIMANVDEKACRTQINSLCKGLQNLILAKNVAEKGLGSFLLINVTRNFMFILSSAVSSLYSSSIGHFTLAFVSLVCFSLGHYFIFSLSADQVQKKVCGDLLCAELPPNLKHLFEGGKFSFSLHSTAFHRE